MAVLLLFQNHCGTGVQRAENPDGNEWQAFWWTHKLVQSRKAKVLSLFPSSHCWICPSCNFGCCSAVVAVGLWGVPWGSWAQRGDRRAPAPHPAWVGMCSLLAAEMSLSCCWLCCLWRERSWSLHSSAKTLLTLVTYWAALLEGGRAQVTLGQRRPLPRLLAVAVFFPTKDSQSLILCACDKKPP